MEELFASQRELERDLERTEEKFVALKETIKGNSEYLVVLGTILESQKRRMGVLLERLKRLDYILLMDHQR